MLDPGYTHSVDRDSPEVKALQRPASLRDLFAFLRRSAWTMFAATCATTFAGVLYVSMTAPDYVASAQILIEAQRAQQSLRQDAGVLDLTLNSAQVESQVEVLRSDQTMLPVIRRLNLVKDPEFGSNNLEAAESERLYTAMGKFSARMDVRRVAQSYIIQVSFRSRSAERAAEIANAVAEAYIKNQLLGKVEDAKRAREWLEQRVKQLQEQLHLAAHSAQDFRTNGNLTTNSPKSQLDAEVTLSQLESATATYRKMYEAALQRLAETVQTESFLTSDAKVIAGASKHLAKVYPSPKLVIALSVLVGLLLGIGIAALRNSVDPSLKSVRQVSEELNLPVLGALPRFNRALLPRKRNFLVAHDAAFMAAVRRMKTTIDIARLEKPIRSIGVVSTLPGEGSTTIVGNLGAFFAQSGENTLLIDADVANCELSKALASSADAGLIGTLQRSQQVPTLQFLQPVDDHLAILPAIKAELGKRAANDVLVSKPMKVLIDELTSVFDIVFVDLPATATAPDAIAISPHLDAFILVCQCGKSSVDLIMSAAASLQSSDAQLLGVVVNKIKGGSLTG